MKNPLQTTYIKTKEGYDCFLIFKESVNQKKNELSLTYFITVLTIFNSFYTEGIKEPLTAM
jgi:hypothetical protein